MYIPGGVIRRSLGNLTARSVLHGVYCPSTKLQPILGKRWLGNINVPFQDDLTGADVEDFGLEDFQHYQESEDVRQKWNELAGNENSANQEIESAYNSTITQETVGNSRDIANVVTTKATSSLEEVATVREPVIFRSKLKNPYLNLAIEDYIYNAMPLPPNDTNYNRLMFYTNLPCVVIGKNQNPWKEVNLPLLNSLKIPLIRRRSGGGTVVHDLGNVNYSFMTTKGEFDRFKFANLVRDGVNKISDARYKLIVNERGDITTETQPDGINYKVSGSAYKLSKGKSYHHGTMLLNLRLDILGKLLSREKKLGKVDAMNSIASVKSKVTNVETTEEQFIEKISDEFSNSFGTQSIRTEEEQDAFEQNELLGLNDFMGDQKAVQTVTIDEEMALPQSVIELSEELKSWKWKFGTTPKFTHQFFNEKYGFSIKFHVDKGAILSKFELEFEPCDRMLLEKRIRDSFHYLEVYLRDGELSYTGSDIAGFVTEDMISDWIGDSIDGTV